MKTDAELLEWRSYTCMQLRTKLVENQYCSRADASYSHKLTHVCIRLISSPEDSGIYKFREENNLHGVEGADRMTIIITRSYSRHYEYA